MRIKDDINKPPLKYNCCGLLLKHYLLQSNTPCLYEVARLYLFQFKFVTYFSSSPFMAMVSLRFFNLIHEFILSIHLIHSFLATCVFFILTLQTKTTTEKRGAIFRDREILFRCKQIYVQPLDADISLIHEIWIYKNENNGSITVEIEILPLN